MSSTSKKTQYWCPGDLAEVVNPSRIYSRIDRLTGDDACGFLDKGTVVVLLSSVTPGHWDVSIDYVMVFGGDTFGWIMEDHLHRIIPHPALDVVRRNVNLVGSRS